MAHRRQGSPAISHAVLAIAVVTGTSSLTAPVPAAVEAVGQAAPDLVGRWTAPFEEGGSATPRCAPGDDTSGGHVVCKPVAQGTGVLPDGRVFYFSGIDGNENARFPWIATPRPRCGRRRPGARSPFRRP
jgi:hypothetical protein